MKVSITNGGKTLVIELEVTQGERSKSGKSLVVASTRGIVDSGVQVQGKALKLGVNAFIEG